MTGSNSSTLRPTIRAFLDGVDTFYELPPSKHSNGYKKLPDVVQQYLETVNFTKQLNRLQRHSSTRQGFYNHFFQWFDGFQVLKFVHFARDFGYPNTDVRSAALLLLKALHIPYQQERGSLLHVFRETDRSRKVAVKGHLLP